MFLRSLTTVACTALLAATTFAQVESPTSKPMPEGDMKDMPMKPSGKPMLSPPASATVKLDGKSVTVNYNAPSMRGRTIYGDIVPYGKIWRTGANPATTLVTQAELTIGSLKVPAGTYTLYTLPAAGQWMLIVNKQTGQWGTEYDQAQDLGRVEMRMSALSTPQEVMSITFEHTHHESTELHIKWAGEDHYVPVKTK